jgi:hypothetical protein
MKREPNALGYNWITLFLGKTEAGTWPSRLGIFQIFGGVGYMDVVEALLPYRNATKIVLLLFDLEKICHN